MTTWVSRYQKDKTNLVLTEARDSEWHQLGCMKTDNHASTPPLEFFTGRMPFLPLNQQCQSTEGNNHTYAVVWNTTDAKTLLSAISK